MKLPQKVEIIIEYDKKLKDKLLDSQFLEEIETTNRLMAYNLSFEELDETLTELIKGRWTSQTEERKKQLYGRAHV